MNSLTIKNKKAIKLDPAFFKKDGRTVNDGVRYFIITSDNTTGSQWVERLRSKGFNISRFAVEILFSADFKPTDGTAYCVVLLNGSLWDGSKRTLKKIREDAYSGFFTNGNSLIKPNPEVACLAREKLSGMAAEELGLHWPQWILVMHESINSSLLCIIRHADSSQLGAAMIDEFDSVLYGDAWFAFVLCMD